jgi:hypothetical protein
MNGQYPVYANTGTLGPEGSPQDAKHLDSPGAKQITAWFNFFDDTRHWELEPYFDVDGGRCIALEGVEYVLYVEKPSGPVEVRMEKHGYDVAWFNPITGEILKQKNYKGEKFAAEPPDTAHDWVLYLSREGRKESMGKSYKFESRRIEMQEVEVSAQKVPFEMVSPKAEDISLAHPVKFSAKLRRETRGTRSMMYLWTGEVVTDGQGTRVLGTGREGTLKIDRSIATKLPATLSLRLAGMNANGKVYYVDRVVTLTK